MYEALDTLCLLASIQGFLLAVVLLMRKQNHTANKILAIATIFLSIDLIFAVYYAKGWYKEFPHLMGVSYPFPLLYGPIFYLYVRFISKNAELFQKKDLLHFLPIIIVYLFCIPEFFFTAEQKIVFVENMIHEIHSVKFTIFEKIVPVQGALYTFFTIKIVRDYDRKIKNAYSNIDLINLNWMKYLSIAGFVIWTVVALLTYIHELVPGLNIFLQISLSTLIYSIGYKGLRQPEIFLNPSNNLPEAAQSEKYKRSGLNDKLADEIGKKLINYMKSDKPFLDNDLSMQKLADQINVSNHNLSEVINSKFNISYYDFINNYRVEEFKSRIADSGNDAYNILSVAFDSGFKSKGTFNSIFKKNTGLTPSEYRSKLRRTNS